LPLRRADILIPPRSRVTVFSEVSSDGRCTPSLSCTVAFVGGSANMSGRALVLLSALAATFALSLGSARAASWWELNFYLSGPCYEGILPPCDYPGALSRIASRFNQKEGQYWNSDLKIVNFEHLRETSFRSWAANSIPRRFCSGIVEISDGTKRP